MMVCWTQSARSWNTVSMPALRERAAFQCVSRLPRTRISPLRRLDRAGEHLDQRRFAGAVVAEQADDLAAVDMQVDAADREHPAVGLGDVSSSISRSPIAVSPEQRARPATPASGAPETVRPISADPRSRDRRPPCNFPA